ncbi:MAG: precorrin-6A reductase [Pseudobutyrivibrio sp.]|nr:precorrin-6A reductase [Pseudobutyrivibrio sp.]
MTERILIFSGTTEGRCLTEKLAEAGYSSLVCVATEYGSEVMRKMSNFEIKEGRMDLDAMEKLMISERFKAVCDATHPFATEVSKNIKQACQASGKDYIRIKRDTVSDFKEMEDKIHYFDSNEECAKFLASKTSGRVLLTTGSKELACYCQNEDLRERLVVRVLPALESIEICKNCGIKGASIIAMQGPFSTAMNEAMLREYDISCLVTKESGSKGGFFEKLEAANKLGCEVMVIGNPDKEQGISVEEAFSKLTGISENKPKPKESLKVSLVGIGMGNEACLTQEAKDRILEADYIFGAKRILDCVRSWEINLNDKRMIEEYLASDIVPRLKEMSAGKVVILFSGDSGFYSGAEKMKIALKNYEKKSNTVLDLSICPGISSVSSLASRAMVSYTDAKIMSIHGRGEKKELSAEILGAVRYNEKTFILLSGAEDLGFVGELLEENGLGDCQMVVGFNLSAKNEKVLWLTAKECKSQKEKGSYILLVINSDKESRVLAPCLKDDDFIRGKVPMTKEEVRQLAICKLRLKPYSVCYDIGAGTGSVAVEMAKRDDTIKVFAMEQKSEAVSLIKENARKHQTGNITIIEGTAPEAMENLPAATHALIGGSSGKLTAILRKLAERADKVRVVITAVTVETISQLPKILEEFEVEEEEILQLQASRAQKLGGYHLFKAENPVVICSFTLVSKINQSEEI